MKRFLRKLKNLILKISGVKIKCENCSFSTTIFKTEKESPMFCELKQSLCSSINVGNNCQHHRKRYLGKFDEWK